MRRENNQVRANVWKHKMKTSDKPDDVMSLGVEVYFYLTA